MVLFVGLSASQELLQGLRLLALCLEEVEAVAGGFSPGFASLLDLSTMFQVRPSIWA